MGYEVYVDHPDSLRKRSKDFAAWSVWAPVHAPWTGVGISDMAKLVEKICSQPMNDTAKGACLVLDLGGTLDPEAVREVYRLAGSVMNEKVREVFHRAVEDRYGVRVVFSKGFGSMPATAYLAKHWSA